MRPSVVRFCLGCRLHLIAGVVVQGEATVEVGLSGVAEVDHRVDGAAQAGFGPTGIHGKRLSRQLQPGNVGVVTVVLHQADGVVVSACAIEFGAAQGVFVGHPALN